MTFCDRLAHAALAALCVPGALGAQPPSSLERQEQEERRFRDLERKREFERHSRQMIDELRIREEREKSKNLIVMISGRLGEADVFGAGIIFGRDCGKGLLYVVTANHVVRTRTAEAAGVKVKVRPVPERELSAMLLPQADYELDVATLVVEGAPVPPKSQPRSSALGAQFLALDAPRLGPKWAPGGFDICKLDLDQLNTEASVRRGAEVYPVGNPNGVPWAEPVRPDVVSDVLDDQIVFQSMVIARGHSGGGLLDARGYLIGMIQADEPPFGRALNLHKVLRILRTWKYPLQLCTAGGKPDSGTR